MDGPMGMGDPAVPSVEALQKIIGDSMPNVERELNCTNGCVELLQEFRTHPTWFCEGGPQIYEGGNWIGHVFPGTVFVFWATHWLLGFVRHYYESRQHGHAYQSKSCFRFLWFPERWPMEAVVKVVFPCLAMVLELWLGHGGAPSPSAYRRLYCEPGTAREGHLIGNHINNWQHATMYPGFIVSGIVDLVALVVDVPPGISQIILGMSFFNEALLFGLHGKHEPMDILVHQILAWSGFAAAVAPMLEGVWISNPLLTAGRIATTYLHGAWFLAAARMMYEDHPAWDLNKNKDFAPVLYAPMVLVSLMMWIMIGIVAAMVLGHIIYRPRARTSKPHSTDAWE